MVWMLVRPGQAVPAPEGLPLIAANDPAGDPDLAGAGRDPLALTTIQHDPFSESPNQGLETGRTTVEVPLQQAPRREAWVMHGDIAHALYQSGMLEILLERMGAPLLVYSGGTSAVNAMLICSGSVVSLRQGWEELREQHLLFETAIEQAPLLRPVINGHHTLTLFVDSQLSQRRFDAATVDLLLMCGDRYLSVPSSGRSLDTRTVALTSLAQHNTGPGPWISAIEHAATSGVDRILMLGLEDTVARDADLLRATESARERSVEVDALGFDSAEKPGLLDFLLPGSGTPERLMRDGREAALCWVEERD